MYLVILNFDSNVVDIVLYNELEDVDNEDFVLEDWIAEHYDINDIQYMISDYLNIQI